LGLTAVVLAQQPCQVVNPRVVTRVEPKYTERARRDGIEGDVTLQLVVNEQGMPTNIALYEGIDPGLNQRAIEALQHWRWYPATCAGKPVALSTKIDFHFRLHKQQEPSQPLQWDSNPAQQPNQTPSLKQAEPQSQFNPEPFVTTNTLIRGGQHVHVA
jgi:TonB family protein